MKKLKKISILCIFIFIISISILYGQIGAMIPDDRLPDLEDGVLPWQKAGYISQLEDDEKIEITRIIDVTTNLDTIPGNSLNSKIQYVIDSFDYEDDKIMFYFPSGVYEMYNTIEIGRSNIIFKGAGSENTTLKFIHAFLLQFSPTNTWQALYS